MRRRQTDSQSLDLLLVKQHLLAGGWAMLALLLLAEVALRQTKL